MTCNANSGASLSKLMRIKESKGEGNVRERERERERNLLTITSSIIVMRFGVRDIY